MSSERTFTNAPESVAAARRYVVAAVGAVPRDVVDDVAVMVSDLPTNAVRHAATRFTLPVRRTSGEIRVAVTDAGAGEPAARNPSGTEETGRGLRIVDALADDWGVTPTSAPP